MARLLLLFVGTQLGYASLDSGEKSGVIFKTSEEGEIRMLAGIFGMVGTVWFMILTLLVCFLSMLGQVLAQFLIYFPLILELL